MNGMRGIFFINMGMQFITKLNQRQNIKHKMFFDLACEVQSKHRGMFFDE